MTGSAVLSAASHAAPPGEIEKAAIILTAIGPELAASVLREVSSSSLKRFAQVTASLGPVTQQTLDKVITEFLDALAAGSDVAGGANAVRRLLAGILDEDQIAELLGDAGQQQETVWERMNMAPITAIAGYVGKEHPQTAAVILSELKPDVAASVLERLDQAFARDVVLRLSREPSLDRRMHGILGKAIEQDFLSALQQSLSKRRPAELIASLMNNISSEVRDDILTHLEHAVPDLASDVQRSMFTFADIATRLPPRDIGTIVREVGEEILLPALKFGQMQGSDSVKFILENIPRRLADHYAEELAQMDDVSRKEGEAAHIELTRLILARQTAGIISFIERDDD